jgi:hypothetical protein
MSRSIHLCVSVRGNLCKTDAKLRREWKGSAGVSRDFWMDQLAMGREVIPFGDPCEGFDYKKGCPGHEEIRKCEACGKPDPTLAVGLCLECIEKGNVRP